MRRLLFACLAILLVAAPSASFAAGRTAWRLGLSYLQPGASDYRDYGRGIQSFRVEYSVGDTFEDENSASDASFYFEYAHVKYSQADWAVPPVRYDAHVNVAAIGAIIRCGEGAKPGDDGPYAGFGSGFAYGSPSVRGLVPSYGGFQDGGSYKFQWKVMTGLNWGKAMFAEAAYSNISRDGLLTLSVGVRF